MANRSIFVAPNAVVAPNTINAAGGAAYAMSAKEALAQYVVTATFNGTFYANADEHVDQCLALCNQINDPVFIAKAAVYGSTVGKMKDVPVVLLAWLAANGHSTQVQQAFPKICNNFKQVSNFAQVIRSGKLGRKSFGTVLKRLINSYLTSTEVDKLFTGSVGVGNPSLVDVVKMTHPKGDAKHNAFFAYMLDKEYNKRYLSPLIKQYEAYKKNPVGETPDVPFQLLTNLTLSKEQWKSVAKNMPWNTLRMNLNSLQNKGLFNDSEFVDQVASDLVDAQAIRYSKSFPYSIMAAYLNTVGNVPNKISNALQDALEVATENVPALTGKVAVLVDVSSSMDSPVTGYRQGATSKVTCLQVAALVGSTILRKNPDALVIPFDTTVRQIALNSRDSVMTNAQKLAIHGGGTDISVGLRLLNQQRVNVDAVIIVSDNESWAGRNNSYQEWATLKQRNQKAKLVMLDVVPNTTTPVLSGKDVLPVGGFSDECWTVINEFLSGNSTNVVKTIDSITL